VVSSSGGRELHCLPPGIWNLLIRKIPACHMTYPLPFWKTLTILLVFPLLACQTQQDVKILQGEIEAADILKILEKGKAVHLEDAVVNGDLYLSDALQALPFSSETANYYVSKVLLFTNCRFRGKVFAQRPNEVGQQFNKVVFQRHVTFQNCIFQDEVSFIGSQFLTDVSFAGSSFEAKANFDNISCHGMAVYRSVNFLLDGSFQNAWFLRDLNMVQASFKQMASFQGTIYHQRALFTEASFLGYADFGNQDFRGGAHFTYAQFQDQAHFNYSKFRDIADLNRLRFGKAGNFKGCSFAGTTRFNRSEYRATLDLREALFLQGEPEMKDVITGPESELLQD
jgi:uncharacterized protein YjbI with pentapeptide repeats